MRNNSDFEKGHSPLTDDERAVLDFEAKPFKYMGDKESAIYDTFGHSPSRHFQKLNSIIDKPAAAEYSPALVNRLLRQRDERRQQRSAKRQGLQI